MHAQEIIYEWPDILYLAPVRVGHIETKKPEQIQTTHNFNSMDQQEMQNLKDSQFTNKNRRRNHKSETNFSSHKIGDINVKLFHATICKLLETKILTYIGKQTPD